MRIRNRCRKLGKKLRRPRRGAGSSGLETLESRLLLAATGPQYGIVGGLLALGDGLNWQDFHGSIDQPSASVKAGAATGPVLTVSDDSFFRYDGQAYLPETQVGIASGPAIFTLTNAGDAPLDISYAVGGDDWADFTATAYNGLHALLGQSFSLPAGTSCTLEVYLDPVTAGHKSATVNLTTNDPNQPAIQLTLEGYAHASGASYPVLVVGDGSGYYPDDCWATLPKTRVGYTGGPAVFTLTNAGDLPLGISGWSSTDGHAADFSLLAYDDQGGPLGAAFSIPAGASYTLEVYFNPTSAGRRYNIVELTTDDPNVWWDDWALGMDGNALVGPVLGVSDDSYYPDDYHVSLPDAQVGDSSGPAIFTLTNFGDVPLGVSYGLGGDAADFTVEAYDDQYNPLLGQSFSILVGMSYSLEVYFNPGSEGGKSAQIDLLTNDPSEPSPVLTMDGYALPPDVMEVNLARDIQYNGGSTPDYRYTLDVSGLDLTGVLVTTPWGTQYDLGVLLPRPWGGQTVHLVDTGLNLTFDAGTRDGQRFISALLEQLTGAQWASLNAAPSQIVAYYGAGGTWTGNVDFSGTTQPAQRPVFVEPHAGQTTLPQMPWILWQSWAGAPADGMVRLTNLPTGGTVVLPGSAISGQMGQALSRDADYQWRLEFIDPCAFALNGATVNVTSGISDTSPLAHTAAAPSGMLTVQRGIEYNAPGSADDEYIFQVELHGPDVTRLQFTTPWGQSFDSDTYLASGWSGWPSEYDYYDATLEVELYNDPDGNRDIWVQFVLTSGQWAQLDANNVVVTVTTAGGSWTGQTSFAQSGVALPGDVPTFTGPTEGQTGVSLQPTFRWSPWASAPGNTGIFYNLNYAGQDNNDIFELPDWTALAPDLTQWTTPGLLDANTGYTFELGFGDAGMATDNGVTFYVVSYVSSEVNFTTGDQVVNPPPVDINVDLQRDIDFERSRRGNGQYEYMAQVDGPDLAGLVITTPWGRVIDSADYLPPGWSGQAFYDNPGRGEEFWLEGGTDNGRLWIRIGWDNLTAAHWASLDVGQTTFDVTCASGTWTGSADFSSVTQPTQRPRLISPLDGKTNLPFSPTFRWGPWSAATANGYCRAQLIDMAENTLFEEAFAAGATRWTLPGALDPLTVYELELNFTDAAAVTANNVQVNVSAYTQIDPEFITARKADVAGNDPAGARKLGSLLVHETVDDFVGAKDRNDFFQFQMPAPGQVRVKLSDLSGDANLELFDGNGELVSASENADDADEAIRADLAGGTYYVRVYAEGKANTPYTLDIIRGIGGADRPDLQGDFGDLSGVHLRRGRQVTVPVVITNRGFFGATAAEGSIVVELLATTGDRPGDEDVLISRKRVVVHLGAGRSQTVNFTFTVGRGANRGNIRLLTKVDATDNLEESNEANNQAVSRLFQVA